MKSKQMEKTTKTTIKKAYEKPGLRIVNISGGIQTLGIGCKTATGGGTSNPIAVPCWANNCSQNGS
jgi:hypothetical protein